MFSSKATYGRVIEIEERKMDGERRGELALRQVWPRESPWRNERNGQSRMSRVIES